MDLFWVCPNCNNKVYFLNQLYYYFNGNGEALFDTNNGLHMHKILCNCGHNWIFHISNIQKDILRVNNVNNILEKIYGDQIKYIIKKKRHNIFLNWVDEETDSLNEAVVYDNQKDALKALDIICGDFHVRNNSRPYEIKKIKITIELLDKE